MPGPFETLLSLCDERNSKAVFLLLGSASLDLIAGVSETFAGRIIFVDVVGFSLNEAGVGNQDRLWIQGRFSLSLSGLFGCGMDALDAVVHMHVPGA